MSLRRLGQAEMRQAVSLRGELATNAHDMIKVKAPFPDAVPMGLGELLNGHGFDLRQWGSLPSNGDTGALIQMAVDQMPIGAVLIIPAGPTADYRYITSEQIDINNRISVWISPGASIQGIYPSGDTTSDLFNITHNKLPDTDSRGWFFEGGRSIAITNGRHALAVTADGPSLYNGQFHIRNIRYIGVPDAQTHSRAIYIKNLDQPEDEVQHFTIEHVNAENGIDLAGVTDGGKLIRVQSIGIRGVVWEPESGAWQQTMRDCLCLARDGGLTIIGGGCYDFYNVHLEQQVIPGRAGGNVNLSAHGAQLYINGARNVRIIGGNAGGGTNCLVPIKISGAADDVLIDGMQFRVGSDGNDIEIDAAVEDTFIGRNSPQGARIVTDPGNALRVADAGIGTGGLWKPVGALSNGWTLGANGLRYMRDSKSILHVEGSLIVGTGATGTAIDVLTLPLGFRPPAATPLGVATLAGTNTIKMQVLADGRIQATHATAADQVFFTGSFRAVAPSDYEQGVL